MKLLEILVSPWRWYKRRQEIKKMRMRDPFIYK